MMKAVVYIMRKDNTIITLASKLFLSLKKAEIWARDYTEEHYQGGY